MSINSPSKIARLFILMFFVAAPVCAGDKEEKERLERLPARIKEVKTEIIILACQAQSFRDTISTSRGS